MRLLIVSICFFATTIAYSQERVASLPLGIKGYYSPSVFADKQLRQHYFVFYNQPDALWEYHITDLQFKEVATLFRNTSSQIKIKAIWQDTANINTLYSDSKGELRLLVFCKAAQTFSVNPLNKLPLQGKLMAIGADADVGFALTYLKKKNAVQVYRFTAGDVQMDKTFVFPADVDAKKAAKAETLFTTRDLDKLEEYTQPSKITIEDQKIYITVENEIDNILSTDVFTLNLADGTCRVNTLLYPNVIKAQSITELLRDAQSNSYYFQGYLYQCAVSKAFLLLQVTDLVSGKVIFSDVRLAKEAIPYKTSPFLIDRDFTGVAYETAYETSNTADFLSYFDKEFLSHGAYDLFLKVQALNDRQVELTIGGTYSYFKSNETGFVHTGMLPLTGMMASQTSSKRDNVNLFFKSVLNRDNLEPIQAAGTAGYDKLVAFWGTKRGKDFNWWGLAADDPDNRERKKRVKFFKLGDGAFYMGLADLKNKVYEVYRSEP